MTRRVALSGAGVLGALALLWLLWDAPPGPAGPARTAPAGAPSVVIYLVDTLRRDHLGVYGYERDTSPRLDAFARDAVVFERAYSPTSWTRPATVSLLTGLAPWRHRVNGRLDVVADDVPFLSEHLQEAGYRTLAFVTNPNVIPLWGFDQGFDHFEDIDSESRAADADALVDRVIEGLDAVPRDQPFFLYVHAIDPHEPYKPPAGYARRFADGSGPFTGRYDGEIAFGDYHFGRLLDRLRARGQYDDALVVFVSDHGEELGDHGGSGHGHTLFEEVVRIPLLVKLPKNARAGERIDEVTTLMDVAPAILAALGRPAPLGLDGRDPLGPASEGSARDQALYFDLELDWNGGRTDIVRAVRVGERKYLRRVRPEESELLFDLAADPGETADLGAADPEAAAELSALLDAHLTARATGVHLRVIHSEWGEDRRCRIALETPGRFEALSTRLLEPGDRVELSDGGSRLHLDVALRNYPHPTGGVPRVVIDEDAVSLDVTPPDAEIALVALPDGEREPCEVWLGPGHERLRGDRLLFDTGREDLAVRDLGPLLRGEGVGGDPLPQGVYLAVVRAARARSDVPEDVEARLRELGYLE